MGISAERHASTTHDPVNSEHGRRARDTKAGLISRQIGFTSGADHVILRTGSADASVGVELQNSVQSRRWNGDESVEVCFNNDQTTGISKRHLNSPPLNYSDAEQFLS